MSGPRVLVLGGGPAGAALALTLAEAGVRALVIERASGLRDKPGECLGGEFRALLERLGVIDRMTGHRRIPSFESRWDAGVKVERELIAEPYGEGWLLDRRRFEAQLIAAASERGASWQLGWTIAAIERVGGGWSVELNREAERRRVAADFLVDASGRAAKLLRSLDEPRRTVDRLFGSWMVTTGGAVAGGDGPVRIEAEADGWWYGAALPDGRASLVWFSDHASTGVDALLARARECELIRGMVGRVDAGISTHPAGSARATRACGPGWFAIGDAAQAFDPLSSYGIGSALGTGFYAAQALLSCWAGDERAQASYQALLDQRWLAYLVAVGERYAAVHPWFEQRFWVERRERLAAELRDHSSSHERAWPAPPALVR